ncbi:MAG: hypothetical protein ABR503_16485 [Chitinophagaceae bacterium]
MAAKYTAPAIMPERNGVVIWAEVYRKGKKGKVLRRRLTYYSIEVYDQYKVTAIFNMSSAADIIDSASFIATVYPNEVIVTDPLNYPSHCKNA